MERPIDRMKAGVRIVRYSGINLDFGSLNY